MHDSPDALLLVNSMTTPTCTYMYIMCTIQYIYVYSTGVTSIKRVGPELINYSDV